MKFIVGQVFHETNTFCTMPTTVASFQEWEWVRGKAVLEKNKGVENYLGGLIDRAVQLGIDVHPTFSALAYPAGRITEATYEIIKNELLTGLKTAGPCDAICLALHGAGVTEKTDDLEGELLQSIRELVGYEIPLIITLDLHANVTEKMVKEADLIIGNIKYPHVDSYERGKEAIDLAKKIVEGEFNPKMHLTKLPLLIPTSCTHFSPMMELNEECRKWEEVERVVDCTIFHGFPYTDISDMGVTVITITDNDLPLAKRVSEDIASKIWEVKEEFFVTHYSPHEGLEAAQAYESGPIIINETSDNPGGGAPGDGTHLLKAMLDEKVENACFGFIYDPGVAETAHKAGVGEIIEVKLGGKTDQLHGDPVAIRAYVKCLTDGKFIQTSQAMKGMSVNYGKTARLQVGGIEIIVCSVRGQTLDEQVFLLHGIDVTNYNIVALKSSHHFRASFEPLSKKIITVDSPGLCSCNLTHFVYQKFHKSVYPLKELKDRNEAITNKV